MFKKVLLVVAVLTLITLTMGYLFRAELSMALIATQIKPQTDFDPALAPAAPDYSTADAWAALPDRRDPSDDHPIEFTLAEDTRGVAVFFVHPTSYMSKANWNQPLDDTDANWVVDNRVLRHQASVFNGCCDVYAPRYRQATFFSFMDNGVNGTAALDLAYSDVSRAFDAFLERTDGPFILAGHSQGTAHAARLLRERISGTALQSELIAAYLIGFSIARDQLGEVPVCTSATQTGCVIGWNAVEGDARGVFGDVPNLVCTNPLSWVADGGYAGHSLNAGGVGYPSYGRPAEGEDPTLMSLEPEAADAICDEGVLQVRQLRSESFPSRMPGDSMHVYDYSLFYANLRSNATDRVNAFLSTSSEDA
ncbi:MAG: DUF3089 domain-containing protein [Pseudomonadales bacterium]|nr:DUF3089 domain-containing protein [Pseudomonadales bacterium]